MKILKKFCLLIMSLLLSNALLAQSIRTVSGKKVDVNKLNLQIEAIMDSLEIPALSIAIINENQVSYHEAFGVSNSENKNVIDENSIFEAASLSKPIFAYFVMKMVERGKIDLDKALYEYLPHPAIVEEDQERYKLITPRMVLSH
ncbi:MAG: serine hydrolase domain-containing protein, partial [Bacteroidota bacterium]